MELERLIRICYSLRTQYGFPNQRLKLLLGVNWVKSRDNFVDGRVQRAVLFCQFIKRPNLAECKDAKIICTSLFLLKRYPQARFQAIEN